MTDHHASSAGQPGATASGNVHQMTTNPAPRSRLADFTTASLTFIAAGLATGVAAVGMWRFFGDILGITNPYIRGGFFAFLEIALFVSAIRARRNLLEELAELKADGADTRRASTGPDGVAVWVLAATSGVFSAIDGHSWGERIFRLVAPLVAAWLWERGLAAHRRRARGVRTLRGVDWSGLLDRVLIRLRLRHVAEQSATEVERARRIAHLAALRFRLNELSDGATLRLFRGVRVRRATTRFEVALAKANRDLGVAGEASLRLALQMHLAVLYDAVAGTSPAAVAGLAPWGETAPDLRVAPHDTPAVAPATEAVAPRPKVVVSRRTIAPPKPSRAAATKAAVAGATTRTDEVLVDIIAPLVAAPDGPPSQRALQKAIKDATGAGVNNKRLESLVDIARNNGRGSSRNGSSDDDQERHPEPLNGSRQHPEFAGVA
jgi:hypothetical protein